MDLDLLKEIVQARKSVDQAILATICRTQGSTPRKAGAGMLVFNDGMIKGTIGGGSAEAEVQKVALSILEMRKSLVYHLNLNQDFAAEEGMVCGGNMELILSPIENEGFWEELLRRSNSGEEMVIVTGLSRKQELTGKKAAIFKNGTMVGNLKLIDILKGNDGSVCPSQPDEKIIEIRDKDEIIEVFVEPIIQSKKLIVLGGGHIAVPLVKIASILGYKTIVVDDRYLFANKERFPEASEVLCMSFGEALAGLRLDNQSFVVIITRGHRYDLECLKKVAGSRAAYIGMIGSRRRVSGVLKHLLDSGFPREAVQGIYTPIGLDIGAQTPEEIALSIMAEVVKVHRVGKAE